MFVPIVQRGSIIRLCVSSLFDERRGTRGCQFVQCSRIGR